MNEMRLKVIAWLSSRNHGWQPLVAMLAVGSMNALLSESLSVYNSFSRWMGIPGDWIAPVSNSFLFILAFTGWILGRRQWLARVSQVYAGLVTLQLGFGVAELLRTLRFLKGGDQASRLLVDAGVIWLINVLVFSVWYWLIDGGGPERRHQEHSARADFAFPQQVSALPGWLHWHPAYFDYLFLAFNTSTAFSPTDTLVLSRRVKALMMIQALISLITLATLAARAVNILA